jgi:hypothetical protein
LTEALHFEFAIAGAPRTKKNHGRRKYSFRLKRTLNIPSEAYEDWASQALRSLPSIRRAAEFAGIVLPIEADVNCAAIFHRQALAGDAVGYYQGVADWMENVNILRNDVQIVSWDGSRLAKDATNPRIEVRLEFLPPQPKPARAPRKKAPPTKLKGDRRG